MENRYVVVPVDLSEPGYILVSKLISVQASTPQLEQAKFDAAEMAVKHGVPFAVATADDNGPLPLPGGSRLAEVVCISQPTLLWHHRNRMADERYLAAVHWAVAQVMLTLTQWYEQDELLSEAITSIEEPGAVGQYHRSEVAAALVKQRAELAQYTLMTLNEVPDLDDFSPTDVVGAEIKSELVA